MKKILFSILPLMLLFGCSSYISRYFYSYEQVDGSSKQSVQRNELYAGYNQYYEDEIIKLHLDCEPMGIRLYIINKTNQSVSIIWDSTRVFSEYLKKTVLFTHSNKTQDYIVLPDSLAPDFIEKDTLVKLRNLDSLSVTKASIILANHTWMDEIQFNKNEYLLPYQLTNKELLDNESSKVIGKKVKLQLPINVNDQVIKYTFVFTVKEYEILSK
jgi:hypothetical protein